MIQTTYFLFREKSETVRTCDWKVAKNVNTEDDDTFPGTESGATDDCDDRRNIAHHSPARNLASARVLRVTETKMSKSLLLPQVDTPRPDTARIWGNATRQYHLYISERGIHR